MLGVYLGFGLGLGVVVFFGSFFGWSVVGWFFFVFSSGFCEFFFVY